MEKASATSSDRSDAIVKEIVKSILEFSNHQLAGPTLDDEQKESLSVAKQCFEACYDLDDSNIDGAANLVEMFKGLNLPKTANTKVDTSPDQEVEAERFKVQGNDAMKDGDFELAVDFYSKAIKLNGSKAIYYCNRAAALSRLDRHPDAILDCNEAIKLDPSYGKAYGRLGIAYSHLSLYKEAADAYRKALQLDPTNTTYEANLKLAEEKNTPQNDTQMNFDFGAFMNNPTFIGMASQMLNDPSFRNMVSGLMTTTPGDTNIESFVEVLNDSGQRLAERMQARDPEALQNLRQTFGMGEQGQGDFPLPPEPRDDDDDDDDDDEPNSD